MYLKKLSIKGFKSFANDTVINFEPGITAIIGPNGAGKSNIVDAVRWVLGEQSLKSLRGSNNMTDIIFSGTKQKKQQNFSTVSIVLDNKNRYLPLKTDEIEIKRRLYRDGTNDYFINNEACRLKDVTNLIVDSGTEKESFNIISQGNIEGIINSRAIDRRSIFESAAGVLKYKKRKEETLRKLERTDLNIRRVDDIIKELEVSLKPLKRQSEAAFKFEDYNELLRINTITLITHSIKILNGDFLSKKDIAKVLEDEISLMGVSSNKNETKIFTMKTELADINHMIGDYQKEQVRLAALVEKLNGEKNLIIEKKKSVFDGNELVKLKDEQLKIDNNLIVVNNDISVLKSDINGYLSEDIIMRSDKIKNEIYEVNKELSIEVKNKLRVESSISYLENRIDSNDGLPRAVKSVLNNIKLDGIHNTVGNSIEFIKDYSKAINVSLGGALNNVIVENEKSAINAINYLKTNNIGRATFLPITNIKSRYIDESVLSMLLTATGFVSVLSDVVKYNPIYTNIIQSYLGNVLLVDKLYNANVISKDINFNYKIVTLDGDVINRGGSFTGGNSNANLIGDKFVLEDNISELKNVIKKIESFENKINELSFELNQNDEKLYFVNRELLEKQQQLEIKEKYKVSLETNSVSVSSSISDFINLSENSLDDVEDKIINNYYETSRMKEELEVKLNNLVSSKFNFENRITELEYEGKVGNKNFNIKFENFKNLEIEINRLDVRLDSLLNELSEYNISFERALIQYPMKDEKDYLEQSIIEYKLKIKSLGVVNIGAVDEYKRVNERYEFLTSQVNDLLNAKDSLISVISDMDKVMEVNFLNSFNLINDHFKMVFKELFNGGDAYLELTDPNNLLETGVEIIASPPSKKLSSINLLSGGEKTFTAISLLFAILKSRPVPFCILDEIESALDDGNVLSFGRYLSNLKVSTQFILITHKKLTMEFSDILYGITMEEPGVSKVVSVKFNEI